MAKYLRLIITVLLVMLTLGFLLITGNGYRAAYKYQQYSQLPLMDPAEMHHLSFGYPTESMLHTIEQNAFSPDGVMLTEYGDEIGQQFNPLFIAGFAMQLMWDAENGSSRALGVIRTQLDFLVENAHQSESGDLLFPYKFVAPMYAEQVPWYSAMAQARVAQALAWANQLSPHSGYLEAARSAIRAMNDPNLGLIIELKNGLWLKEFPDWKYYVLDGFLSAVASLLSLQRLLPAEDPLQPELARLKQGAYKGLLANAHCFQSPVIGHYFADNYKVPTESYYKANINYLTYLSGDMPELGKIAKSYTAREIGGLWEIFKAGIWRLKRKRLYGQARENLLPACVS